MNGKGNVVDSHRDTVTVRVFNESGNEMPAYASEHASGLDVRSAEDGFKMWPGQIRIVKTGLYAEVPPGYEIQVRPRSGLAAKKGITVNNSPGTIDAKTGRIIGVVKRGELLEA